MGSIIEELYWNNTVVNDSIGIDESLLENNLNASNFTSTSLSETKRRIFSIMIPIVLSFCFLSFVLSLCVVCCTPFVKRPMSPTIRLSLSLSAANSAFALIVFIGAAIHSYLPVVFDIHLPTCIQLTIEAIRLGFILVQVYHLVTVALVHYFGTLRPLRYASTLTPIVLKVILAILWITPILGMFITFSSIPDQGYQSPQCKDNHFRLHGSMFRYVWSCLFFGPTILLVVVYTHIFYILRKRGMNILNTEQRKTQYKNVKTIKTTAMIVGMFFIGWVPAVLAFMIVCTDCIIQVKDIRVSIAIFSSSYILFILKVFVDTFIYALRLPEIREAIRIMRWYIAARLCCRPETRNRRYVGSKFSSTRSTYFSNSSARERSLRSQSSVKREEPQKPMYELQPLQENHNGKILNRG